LSKEWGEAENKFRVIPNPIDESLFSPGLQSDRIKSEIIFVGRLEERKGVFDFAAAVAPLLENYPNLTVRYIGLDGTTPTSIDSNNRLASQFILSNLNSACRARVSFAGHIPVTSIIQYWRDALCAVVPSRMLESFSYTLVEAMACGCPVIASRYGGPSEIVSDEFDGLLFEPGDIVGLRSAILKLIKSPDLCKKLSINSRQTVERMYSIKVVTRAIIDDYKNVLNRQNLI